MSDQIASYIIDIPLLLTLSGVGICILWAIFKVARCCFPCLKNRKVSRRSTYASVDLERGTSMFNPRATTITRPVPAFLHQQEASYPQCPPRCKCIRCIFKDKNRRCSEEVAIFDTELHDMEDDRKSIASSHRTLVA
jgi:hypothetical protein